MLWYKVWLETRMRFLLSLVGITALVAYQDVYRSLRFVIPTTPVRYFYNLVRFADDTLVVLWLAAVTLLSMGGLLREKAAGTSSFTLTLPVSRLRLVGTRIFMVFVQALLLAAVPWFAVVMEIGTAGKPQLLHQVWFHVVLLLCGGAFFVGLALLVSSAVEGEYTAPMVAFGLVLAMALGMGQSLHGIDPLALVGGGDYFDKSVGLMRGPFPWVRATITAGLGMVLAGAAVKAIQKREF